MEKRIVKIEDEGTYYFLNLEKLTIGDIEDLADRNRNIGRNEATRDLIRTLTT